MTNPHTAKDLISYNKIMISKGELRSMQEIANEVSTCKNYFNTITFKGEIRINDPEVGEVNTKKVYTFYRGSAIDKSESITHIKND